MLDCPQGLHHDQRLWLLLLGDGYKKAQKNAMMVYRYSNQYLCCIFIQILAMDLSFLLEPLHYFHGKKSA